MWNNVVLEIKGVENLGGKIYCRKNLRRQQSLRFVVYTIVTVVSNGSTSVSPVKLARF